MELIKLKLIKSEYNNLPRATYKIRVNNSCVQLFAIEAKPISQIGGNKTINVRQGKGQDNVQEGSLGCPLLPAASAALVVLIYTLLESAVNCTIFAIVL